MIAYSMPVTVNIHDVDCNGVCRTSSLLRYMQSCAEAQLTEQGMSYAELKEKHRAFILSRIAMEFSESPVSGVPLTALTYPCESRGYSFLRCYELQKDEQPIGRAAAVFALMDTESRALVRVDDFRLPLAVGTATEIFGKTHIHLPAVMTDAGTYTVTYADLDQNGHMNNTHYPDVYADRLDMAGKRMSSLTIAFIREAKQGDVLRIERVQEGNLSYFRTRLPDGSVNSEAKIVLSDL